MYVLQHTQKHNNIMPEGGDLAALGLSKGRRISLGGSSLASSMTDITQDTEHRRRTAGPYMEGNMNLLATM